MNAIRMNQDFFFRVAPAALRFAGFVLRLLERPCCAGAAFVFSAARSAAPLGVPRPVHASHPGPAE